MCSKALLPLTDKLQGVTCAGCLLAGMACIAEHLSMQELFCNRNIGFHAFHRKLSCDVAVG